MRNEKSLILVTGATGAQGGAVAAELLDGGFSVRVLTRNTQSPLAQALAGRGAHVTQGDLGDTASIARALHGVHGVFSVQVPDMSGNDDERRHGFNLVNEARKAGVRHFVHTSVAEAGNHTHFPRWGSAYWLEKYWTDKWDIEQAVHNAGFAHWTVLKPAFMMDNFALPKAKFMFPQLREGSILTALLPETRMQLIAAGDVGAFARAAFERPDTFDRKSVDLAAEALTMDEVAATLSRVTGRHVQATSVTPDEALAAGLFPGWVRSQEWTNEWGYRADIAALGGYGVPVTPFAEWVARHVDHIKIGR